jgi:hypothetical protein
MSVEVMRGTLRALAQDQVDFEVSDDLKDWKEGYMTALRAVQKLAKGALEGEPELPEGQGGFENELDFVPD